MQRVLVQAARCVHRLEPGDTVPAGSSDSGAGRAHNATNAAIVHGQGAGTIQNDDAASADLAITKSAPSATYRASDQVTYTITMTNNGPDAAQSVVVTDSLPLQVTFVSCAATGGGACGGTGNNRTVTFGASASGATATITLVAHINATVAGSTRSPTRLTSVSPRLTRTCGTTPARRQ
jgi:uncharacterized repeat protein (TIGR01451 family)